MAKDGDHGRVRAYCSTMRESGSCSNRKIFYMDQIEEAVLAGLQQHLKAPHLLKEYVRAYQDERVRLADDQGARRGKLESQLGQVKRSIDRLLADNQAERVLMDLAGPKLKELRAQKTALERKPLLMKRGSLDYIRLPCASTSNVSPIYNPYSGRACRPDQQENAHPAPSCRQRLIGAFAAGKYLESRGHYGLTSSRKSSRRDDEI